MSTEQKELLNPCPFCGSSASTEYAHGTYEVGCNHCGSTGGLYTSEESAVTDWNRRDDIAQSGHKAAMREAVDTVLKIIYFFSHCKLNNCRRLQ